MEVTKWLKPSGSSARRDLCGGSGVTRPPTATVGAGRADFVHRLGQIMKGFGINFRYAPNSGRKCGESLAPVRLALVSVARRKPALVSVDRTVATPTAL